MPVLTLGLRLDEIGGAGGGGGATATNCMLLTQHPTNPNVIGYSSDFLNGGAEEYGNMIPNTTSDGTLIYSYEIDHSTGLFVLKFGEDSVTKIPNVNDAVLYHNADGAEGNMLFVWDDINKWYSATDLEKATAMKAYIDTVICLEAYAIPIILVWYDFSAVEVGGYVPTPSPSPATFEMFTTASTPNPFEVTFSSPVGTSLSINEVVYEGNDDVYVTASVSWGNIGDRIPFLENVVGCLTYFKISHTYLSGETPDFANNADMTDIWIEKNTLTGTLPSISNNELLDFYIIDATGVSGNIPDFSNNPLLSKVYLRKNNLTGSIPDLSVNILLWGLFLSDNQLTGDIPSLSVNTTIHNINLQNNKLTGFAGGNITLGYDFLAYNNLLTESAVDSILQGLVDGNTTGTRDIQLQTGNAAPSAAGEANIDILRGRGCTVTVEGGY